MWGNPCAHELMIKNMRNALAKTKYIKHEVLHVDGFERS